MGKVFVACALGCLFGCGAKKGEAENTTSADAIKTPATVEQAARVLDLSTFPLMDGAKPPESRQVANLFYVATGDVKTGFEFHRKALVGQGWKELPNSSVTDQSASAMFSRDGFVVSLSVSPHGEPGSVYVMLQNQGNVKPGQLPVPPGTKPVYVGDSTAMYSTEAAVVRDRRRLPQCFPRERLGALRRVAGDSDFFKQNAILVTATVSSAPAQGGKTMIQYSGQLISADIPAPPNVEDLRYADQPPELTFQTAETNQDAIVDFYRKTLATAGWKSTMDKMVAVDDKPTMIFRNPAKDMLTLSVPGVLRGKLLVLGSFSKRGGNRRARSQNKRAGSRASRRRAKQEAAEGGRRVGRTEQGAESRRHTARGCERREADEGRDQVHCRQGESQSGRRILSETVSRRGLERKFRLNGRDERRSLFLKRRRAKSDRHLQRYAYLAVGGQSIGDARRTGSGEVRRLALRLIC